MSIVTTRRLGGAVQAERAVLAASAAQRNQQASEPSRARASSVVCSDLCNRRRAHVLLRCWNEERFATHLASDVEGSPKQDPVRRRNGYRFAAGLGAVA